jgi:hypothetical protein
MKNNRLMRLREAGAATASPALIRGTGDDDPNIGAAGAGGSTGASTDINDDGSPEIKTKPCPTCGGAGVDNGALCATCNGNGQDQSGETVQDMGEAASDTKTCPVCGGDGVIGKSLPCNACDGKGVVPKDWQPKADSGNPFAKGKEAAADLRDLGPLSRVPAAWLADGSLREASVAKLSEKDYSTDTRIQAAKDGNAIPIKNAKGEITGGAFPILDGGDVDDAKSSFGHNPSAVVKAHIVKQARKFGSDDQVKAAQALDSTKESAALESRIAVLETRLSKDADLRESKPDFMGSTFAGMTKVTNSQGQEGYDVVLIREGKGNDQDDNWYTAAAIKEMCESGRAEGMQAYANHPDLEEEELRPERDVRHLIGTHTDVKFAEAGGKGTAKSIFVPLTTNENHPTYGWVTTLAEAAVRSKGPQPLVGWSLYGLSGGDTGTRPDGTEGRIVDLIMPTSGDMVTNAGAGGGFARKLMMESARRLRRANTTTQEEPMNIGQFRVKMTEANKALREADTDEARADALQAIETLTADAEKIDDTPQPAAGTAVLTEAAIAAVKEAAKAEAAGETAELQKKLREANTTLAQFTDVMSIDAVLREAEVTDDDERRHFIAVARQRGLREAADIKDMVETERGYQAKQEERMLASLRESLGDIDFPEVEGAVTAGRSAAPAADGGVALLREAGIPTKEPAAA